MVVAQRQGETQHLRKPFVALPKGKIVNLWNAARKRSWKRDSMHNHSRQRITLTLPVAITICTMLSTSSQTLAQNPELQEKLAAIKQSSAANKQALAHYTWLEQQTISLKGDVKKTQQFQVRIGPDGQQQKTELNPQAPPQPSGGRIKRRIVEKKTDEFEAYGQQIAALGKQYSQPDMRALQTAYQQGNI